MEQKAFAAFITLLSGGVYLNIEEPPPVTGYVNDHDDLLSNDYECSLWNFSITYETVACSPFFLSRSSSVIETAKKRAFECAEKHDSECILSHEVGLSLPVAFFIRNGQVEEEKENY